MSAPAISVRLREKRFGGQLAFSNVSFDVRPGEIVSLVGPSGCGKSTVLRIVAGLETHYDGDVQVLGDRPRLHARNVGLVFQEPRLLPWLSVAANVGFDAGGRGARDPRVQELLNEVSLADVASAYPKTLSGGMAQRAALARGLFNRPALLLLDEPFSAVDAFTRMRLQDLLLRLAAESGAALLLVTHDVGEAAYISDRVIAMSGRPGRVAGEVTVSVSRPRERKHPALARVEQDILALFGEGEAREKPLDLSIQGLRRSAS